MSHRLAEQITSLLLRHPYVVVPGLGGFIRERIPAYYDEAQSLVVPPKAELHFSQELSHSDGLLEESYATLLGVSLRRARLALEEDIKQLRQALIQDGAVRSALPHWPLRMLCWRQAMDMRHCRSLC